MVVRNFVARNVKWGSFAICMYKSGKSWEDGNENFSRERERERERERMWNIVVRRVVIVDGVVMLLCRRVVLLLVMLVLLVNPTPHFATLIKEAKDLSPAQQNLVKGFRIEIVQVEKQRVVHQAMLEVLRQKEIQKYKPQVQPRTDHEAQETFKAKVDSLSHHIGQLLPPLAGPPQLTMVLVQVQHTVEQSIKSKDEDLLHNPELTTEIVPRLVKACEANLESIRSMLKRNRERLILMINSSPDDPMNIMRRDWCTKFLEMIEKLRDSTDRILKRFPEIIN